MKPLSRLVVLVSGQGSNLQAIIDACKNKEISAQVVAVISNKEDAYGLERARKENIPAIIKTKPSAQAREDYDRELAEMIDAEYAPDWIVLAGWMRILSKHFLHRFHNRVLNLHPASPGMFPGINAIERAFAAFQNGEIKHTGVMVHLVPDEGVDCGPILGQTAVPINPDDTLETLSARVHQAEHEVLVGVLRKIVNR